MILVVVAVTSLIVGFVADLPGLLIAAPIIALAAFPVVLFAKIAITTGPQGLTISYGPFGWPTQTIVLDDIEHASAMDDLSPWKWGGWGYRGSLKLFKRAAVNLRRGPAIRLDLTRRRLFIVTVDQPALGVNVLNQAIELRPKRPGS
jgi:hypothetical protein